MRPQRASLVPNVCSADQNSPKIRIYDAHGTGVPQKELKLHSHPVYIIKVRCPDPAADPTCERHHAG